VNQLNEPWPDLILLDWMLPGGSGLQFIKHLKREALTRDIPVVMLTARGEEEDRVRGLETGADDYIPLATNAVRQGLLIGENIVAATKRYPGTQATSAVQLYDLAMSATGLTAGGAKRRGIAAKSTTITQDYRPDFMLTTTPVTTTLVWSPVTRRILGAQFLSKHDISQAANVVSVAIQAGFTIDQLAGADLFFQPNFSQPINFVGAVAIQAVAES